MKKIWVNADPWNKGIVTRALECGADAVVVPTGYTPKVKELGIIQTVAEDGDIKLGENVVILDIKSKEDEEKAAGIAKDKQLILRMKDWTIIPLENLIAQREGLFVEVTDSETAKTAVQILEKGVDGVVLRTEKCGEPLTHHRLIVDDHHRDSHALSLFVCRRDRAGGGGGGGGRPLIGDRRAVGRYAFDDAGASTMAG